MKTTDFDYELPQELIAQTPMEPRDHSRLMVLHRDTGAIEHKHFYDIVDYLNPGDALVINETKVIPARLLGVKEDTGVPVEVLLLRRINATDWEALVRPGRRLKPGAVCSFGDGLLHCTIMENVEETGGRMVRFSYEGVFEELLDKLRLPPGAVTPLGLLNRDVHEVTAYFDEELLTGSGLVGVHPNENTATVWLKTADLIQLLREHGCEVIVTRL